MKLTDDQRRLVEQAVLAVLRDAIHPLRFGDLDIRVRAKLIGDVHAHAFGDWTFRHTDAATQRLRKAGLIKTAGQRWSLAVPKETTP